MKYSSGRLCQLESCSDEKQIILESSHLLNPEVMQAGNVNGCQVETDKFMGD